MRGAPEIRVAPKCSTRIGLQQKRLAKPGSARFPRWRINPSGSQHRRPGEPYSGVREIMISIGFIKVFQTKVTGGKVDYATSGLIN